MGFSGHLEGEARRRNCPQYTQQQDEEEVEAYTSHRFHGRGQVRAIMLILHGKALESGHIQPQGPGLASVVGMSTMEGRNHGGPLSPSTDTQNFAGRCIAARCGLQLLWLLCCLSDYYAVGVPSTELPDG